MQTYTKVLENGLKGTAVTCSPLYNSIRDLRTAATKANNQQKVPSLENCCSSYAKLTFYRTAFCALWWDMATFRNFESNCWASSWTRIQWKSDSSMTGSCRPSEPSLAGKASSSKNGLSIWWVQTLAQHTRFPLWNSFSSLERLY